MTVSREEWLNDAAKVMADWFVEEGFPLPPQVMASFGICGTKAVGLAVDAKSSEDEITPHVFVSPCQKDPIQILGILLHELCHVAAGHECKHGGDFKHLARKFGLAGKLTATFVEDGSPLYDRMLNVAKGLGHLPHVPIVKRTKEKKKPQGGWIKCTSENDPIYILRVSGRAFKAHGAPTDPWGDLMIPHDVDEEGGSE